MAILLTIYKRSERLELKTNLEYLHLKAIKSVPWTCNVVAYIGFWIILQTEKSRFRAGTERKFLFLRTMVSKMFVVSISFIGKACPMSAGHKKS